MRPARRRDANAAWGPGETDFSLVLGGPLYQLLVRTRLARPPLELLYRRVLFIPLFAWLPLLLLSAWEGHALGGVALPFLKDVEAYARWLVALPLMLVAELIVHRRLREVVLQFTSNDIVPPAALPAFHAAIGGARRMRNSMAAEITILALVLVVGPLAWHRGLALDVDTWYAVDGVRTRAGWWFAFVSAPVFQFLLLRWFYRLAIWWRFLWKVSHLPLALEVLHPDRAGGLGFLGRSLHAFLPVLLAQGAVVSGLIGSRVLTGLGKAQDYRIEIATLIAFLVVQVVVPLLFFAPQLLAARRDAMLRFNAFAMEYARAFEDKWLAARGTSGARRPPGDHMLGSADIQSMADLDGSHQILNGMRPIPFDLRTVVRLVVAVAAPFFPLVLTVVPITALLQGVAAMLL